MANELTKLLNDYYKWLKSNTHLLPDEQTGWTAISTPFTGIFNDGIEIYCKKENGKWLLSDGGVTLQLLEETGLSFSRSGKRKKILKHILANYGVTTSHEELIIEATSENFAQKKHYLLQTLLELHELEYLAEPTVKSIFIEDVENMLKKNKILYTRDVKFTGHNGLDYHFDFQVPQFDQEFVIKVSEALRKNTISSFVFSWQSVKKLRENGSGKPFKAAAIVNDLKNEPKKDFVEALEIEGVKPLFWSNQDQILEVLSPVT